MPPVLLDGKAFSKLKLEKLSQSIQAFTSNTGIKPGLAVILVGDDSASQVYVNKKAKTAIDLGMISNVIRLSENTSEEQLLAEINQLNLDENYHGILVQLPLPKHIDTQKIIMSILPEKDVDGFHPTNVGRLSLGLKPFAIPCTPQGVMELLEHHQINLEGQHAIIIGRSNIVGKPMAQLLLSKNATVTIAHSKTKNLQALCLQADVIVAAVGIAQLVKKNWVKPGAVVVDVGINRTEEGKLVGDVDFKDVLEVTFAITPVPGGVGPMTVACLMSNTFNLCQAKHI